MHGAGIPLPQVVDPSIFMPPQMKAMMQMMGMGPACPVPAANPMLAMLGLNPHQAVSSALALDPTAGGILACPSDDIPTADMDIYKIHPEIQELCDKFHIEDRHVKELNKIMEKRQETFQYDLEKLENKLERAKEPNGLLVAKMHEMKEGTFQGMIPPCKAQLEMADKYSLDHAAISKLADILGRYDEAKKLAYLDELKKHLEVSARPSAMVMTMLRKICDGTSLGRPGPMQKDSYMDKQKKEDEEREKKGRGGSRDRGRRERSRSGGHRQREPSRSRERR